MEGEKKEEKDEEKKEKVLLFSFSAYIIDDIHISITSSINYLYFSGYLANKIRLRQIKFAFPNSLNILPTPFPVRKRRGGKKGAGRRNREERPKKKFGQRVQEHKPQFLKMTKKKMFIGQFTLSSPSSRPCSWSCLWCGVIYSPPPSLPMSNLYLTN